MQLGYLSTQCRRSYVYYIAIKQLTYSVAPEVVVVIGTVVAPVMYVEATLVLAGKLVPVITI